VLTAMLVRIVWRALRNLFRGNWGKFFKTRDVEPKS